MKKVLVVDNDKAIRMLYADELAEEGWDTVTCDGSDVLGKIEEKNPDLVIMEVRLKGHSGLDLLRDIKEYYGLPVILCTAYPKFKSNSEINLADHFMVKSSDMRQLKQKVRAILEASGTSNGFITKMSAGLSSRIPLGSIDIGKKP